MTLTSLYVFAGIFVLSSSFFLIRKAALKRATSSGYRKPR